MEWDWKDRGDAWLRLKLRDIREELDGGECTPITVADLERQEKAIQRELAKRARIEATPTTSA